MISITKVVSGSSFIYLICVNSVLQFFDHLFFYLFSPLVCIDLIVQFRSNGPISSQSHFDILHILTPPIIFFVKLFFAGKRCEYLTSLSFLHNSSHVEMEPLNVRPQANVTITFATEQQNGVLLYTGDRQHLVSLFLFATSR